MFLCALVHLAVCVCKCEKSLAMAVFNGYLSKSLAMRIGIRVTVRPFLFVALQGCVCLCVFMTAGAESRNPINSMSLWRENEIVF